MTEPAAARPVLLLYTTADEPFVRGFLVPALGPPPAGAPAGDAATVDPASRIEVRDVTGLGVADLDATLAPGRLVIEVITPAFLVGPWSLELEQIATGAALDRRIELWTLVLEDFPLPLHIRYKEVLDFRSRTDWDDEVARLRSHLARPPPVEAPLPCPYPGMRPFRAGDAKYFHGRDAEIAAVLALVTGGEREITLIGPSGSGKSSLIEAGVLPRMAAEPGAPPLVARTMRPGDAPVRRLADCLETTGAPDAAAVAAWSAQHPGARLVVFVDQLEELFTLAPRAVHEAFAAALRVLHGEPRCLIVLAARADFYAELMQSPLWRDGGRHVDLPPLRGAALREAIELPARELGVYLEPGLVERLLADAAGEPGVLPLLQETLVQLWSHRRQRLLTLAAYEALGDGGRSGLAVAISSRADRCLREMTPAQAVIARRMLLRLVSFGEGRPDTRRRQTRAQLAVGEAPAELDAVLRQLVTARLITVDAGDRGGEPQVDLCHEVLISAWPPFAAWVEARRADEQRRRQIQASAEEWIARGRGASGLLDDGELAAAIAWRRTDAARELGESAQVTALIDASRTAVMQARWRWRRRIAAVVIGLATFATVTATLAVIARRQAHLAETQRAAAETQRQKAETERRNAVQLLGDQYREVGRQAVVEGHLQRAIPYLVAARQQGIDDPGLRMLLRAATTRSVVVAVRHAGPVASVELSRDGARMLTASADGTARVWDAATGAAITPPLDHVRPYSAAMIAGDGTRAVTLDGDAAWLWQVGARPPPPIALRHAARVNAASFSRDGTRVVTASEDRTARVWDARTGQPVSPPLVHDAAVRDAILDPTGARVVTLVTEGQTDGIWDGQTGARLASLQQDFRTTRDGAGVTAHFSLVSSAAFSPDATRIATAGTDNAVLLWDAATGKSLGHRLKHDKWVRMVAFTPDGKQLTALTFDGRPWSWDPATAAALGPAFDTPAPLLYIAYSADGRRLVGSGDDKVIRIWDVATRTLLAAIELESGAMDVAIGPDGTRVATGSADGVARIWDLAEVAPRVLAAGPGSYDAVYSSDGAWIATSRDDGSMALWSAAGALRARLSPKIGGIVRPVFDRQGRRFAVIGSDGSAVLGDLPSAALRPFRRHLGRDPTGGEGPAEVYGHIPPLGAFDPDGKRFATPGPEHTVRIWNSESLAAVVPPLAHPQSVVMVQFSPDGHRVVTACADGTARLWSADTGALEVSLPHAAGSELTGATFSPDGTVIVTTGEDPKVRLWNARSGLLQAVLTGHTARVIAAVFSPDGRLLLTHSLDDSARIWDVATATLAVPPLEHDAWVQSAAFSPDGGRVVTAAGRIAQVWDVHSGRRLAAPFVHPDDVRSAVFSPDGGAVLTAAVDAVRIWDVGLDTRSLDDWLRIARDGSFPQLGEALERLAPASRIGRP